jgi:mRNA-degrading endonuclease RelE of RelBE toxin-antitoxin system
MAFRVTFSPEAREDYENLRAIDRSAVRDAIDQYLVHQPDRVSRSRIKRLRYMEKPQYRLRVGGLRVFYDILAKEVEVVGIVPKAGAVEWLRKWGIES